jgi:acetyl/propionyl-CoA carboxylase alpha subunit
MLLWLSGYSMMTSGDPNSTGTPSSTKIRAILPDFGAGIWFMVFIASMIKTVCPSVTFAPTVTNGAAPGGLGVRMDSALYDGYSIPPYYDSLIGKLIVTGLDREGALARLKRALEELIIDGIDTTTPLFHALLQEEAILTGDYDIHWLEKWLETQSFE